MIRVKIFAPAWCRRSALDERGWTEMADGSTLADALSLIGMPKIIGKSLLAAINGETMPLNTELKDGDVVGFFSVMVGG